MAKDDLGDIIPEVKQAIDNGFSDFIIDTQSQLGEANPKSTGRMSSSWFIGQNQINPTTRDKNWANPGDKRYENPGYDGKITADGNWFISNSVEYAERVALDQNYSGGGDGGPAWFTSITTQLERELDQRIDYYLRKV